MIDGVKLIDCKLTPQERELIEVVRAQGIEFGRIIFITYFQHGKLIRVEMEKVIESKTIAG